MRALLNNPLPDVDASHDDGKSANGTAAASDGIGDALSIVLKLFGHIFHIFWYQVLCIPLVLDGAAAADDDVGCRCP